MTEAISDAVNQALLTFPTRRDRWGRYLVVDPETGKLIGLTRATTISGSLDDKTSLIDWKSRTVIIGLASRPDLVALAAATDPTDKRALNDITERASDAGGATLRRDLGTAVHGFLEARLNDPSASIPSPYDRDVDAIIEAIEGAGLEVVDGMTERMVVHWRHGIAGTFDLLLRDRRSGLLHIADLKTGSSLLGAIGFATQLTIYAQADCLYTQGAAADGSQDVTEIMPAVSQTLAYILHCQPGSGTCQVHGLDLTIGAQALELAMQVRSIRKAKPLVEIVTFEKATDLVLDAFPDAVDVTDEAIGEADREAMRIRLTAIKGAGAEDAIARGWPTGVPRLKGGDPIDHAQHTKLLRFIADLERELGLAFPEMTTPPKVSAPNPASTRRPAPDEGDEIPNPQAATAALNDRAQQLDELGRTWLAATLEACRKANRTVMISGPGGKPTRRRLTICTALMTLAPMADDDLTRALISLAIGEEMQPGHDIGDAIGALTLDEAQRLRKLAEAIDTTTLAPVWGETGVTITGDITAALAA